MTLTLSNCTWCGRYTYDSPPHNIVCQVAMDRFRHVPPRESGQACTCDLCKRRPAPVPGQYGYRPPRRDDDASESALQARGLPL